MAQTLMVEVLFAKAARSMPIAVGYRPHLALPGADYLMGVVFVELGDTFAFDTPILAVIKLAYDGVDYVRLTVGTKFEIREGPRVVGHGVVRG